MRNPVLTRRLKAEERQRIERFVAAYNRIDELLRSRMNAPRQVAFARLLSDFSERYVWPHKASMFAFHDIRNFLAHRITEPDGYSVIPSPEAVQQIQSIAASLERPPRVIPTFERRVITLVADATLEHVFGLIKAHDFSQFPVFRGDAFVGLLTENGITRWLAHRMTENGAPPSLDAPVSSVLREEETRRNVAFMPADSEVDEVLVAFRAQPLLEAVIFTLSGSRDARPLGIATQWDVLARQGM